jgi:hypothetical protein
MDTAHALHQVLTANTEQSMRTGTVVTAPATGRITVAVGGTNMNLPRLASYTPTAGDVVQILTIRKGAWLVLGKTA